jgi:hypothetical protein
MNEEEITLRSIHDSLKSLHHKVDTMSATLSANFLALQAQVAQNATVEGSAITLLQGLSSQLAAAIAAQANGDTAALPALQTQLSTSAAALAAAITANTPAAPAA